MATVENITVDNISGSATSLETKATESKKVLGDIHAIRAAEKSSIGHFNRAYRDLEIIPLLKELEEQVKAGKIKTLGDVKRFLEEASRLPSGKNFSSITDAKTAAELEKAIKGNPKLAKEYYRARAANAILNNTPLYQGGPTLDLLNALKALDSSMDLSTGEQVNTKILAVIKGAIDTYEPEIKKAQEAIYKELKRIDKAIEDALALNSKKANEPKREAKEVSEPHFFKWLRPFIQK
jgi:hypothetical protein